MPEVPEISDNRKASKSRFGWWARIAIAAVVLVALAGAWFGLWWWQCRRELDAEIAKIRARGEPVWFADLEPEYDPEDATALLLDSLSYLSPRAFPQAFYDLLETNPAPKPGPPGKLFGKRAN